MPIHAHVPQCLHIKVNGIRCGSPALRGRDLCYFHDRTRREFGPELPGLLLPLSLESPEAIQVSLMKIMREIVNGALAPRTASLLLRAIQIAVSNSRRLLLDAPGFHSDMVRSLPAAAAPSVAADPAPSPSPDPSVLGGEPPRQTRTLKRQTFAAETSPAAPSVPVDSAPRSSASDLRLPRVLGGASPRQTRNSKPEISDDPLIRELHDLTHAYLTLDRMERDNGNRRKGP